MFLQCLFFVFAANCENSSESDKVLVNERDSECHKAVSDSEMHNADEVSELRFVGELVMSWMREVDYHQVREVGQAGE